MNNKLSHRKEPPTDVVFLSRTSFGIAPDDFYPDKGKGELALFHEGGGSLKDKVSRWVESQLNIPADRILMDIGDLIKPLRDIKHPDNGTEKDIRHFMSIDMSTEQLWHTYFRQREGLHGVDTPRQDHKCLTLNRAIYGRYQLFERLSMFWHNHFNVCSDNHPIIYNLWGTWDQLIRNHLMGNFYQFLLKTAEHPCMLVYLDNYVSVFGANNENYARELLELHTLGVMNYYGLVDQGDVPKYTVTDGVPQEWIGEPKGYVDDDVYNASELLTGWTFDNDFHNKDTDTGLFKYDSKNSSTGEKHIFGHKYATYGRGDYEKFGKKEESGTLKQSRHFIWKAATHPGTAQHIAWKLARHFISDNPPQSVIDAVAKTFLDNIESNDQLKKCYITLFNHPEMYNRSTWGSKRSKPTELIVKSCRNLGVNLVLRAKNRGQNTRKVKIDMKTNASSIIFHRLIAAGHDLWTWKTPDGFPDDSGYWLSSNSVIQTARAINLLDNYSSYQDNKDSKDDDATVVDSYNTTKNGMRVEDQTPEKIVAFWVKRIWGFTPAPKEVEPILEFFCKPKENNKNEPSWPKDKVISDESGKNKGVDSLSYPHYWRKKLRLMTHLVLNHPYSVLR